jgi:hypothetical protein
MILLFELILITFIIVMGLKIAMSKDMLLEKLGSWLEKKAEEKKIFEMFICQWCMATLQSVTAHFFAFGLGLLPFEWNWQLLIRWPLVVMGASFLCGNIWNIYETINRIKEKNEVEAEYLKRVMEGAGEEVNNT